MTLAEDLPSSVLTSSDDLFGVATMTGERESGISWELLAVDGAISVAGAMASVDATTWTFGDDNLCCDVNLVVVGVIGRCDEFDEVVSGCCSASTSPGATMCLRLCCLMRANTSAIGNGSETQSQCAQDALQDMVVDQWSVMKDSNAA